MTHGIEIHPPEYMLPSIPVSCCSSSHFLEEKYQISLVVSTNPKVHYPSQQGQLEGNPPASGFALTIGFSSRFPSLGDSVLMNFISDADFTRMPPSHAREKGEVLGGAKVQPKPCAI